MFYIDEYRSKTLSEAFFNRDILEHLMIMSKDDSIPSTLIYGPPGCGKKTTINLFLTMIFGPDVNNTKDVSYQIIGSGNKKTTEKIKQSNYHIVINPTGTNHDRYLIHDIVKEYAKSKTLNTIFKDGRSFKFVLINNLDHLATNAQAALRRTMERYSESCRFIMWCTSLSKVMKPLRSRCNPVKIASPCDQDIYRYLYYVAALEHIKLTEQEFANIVTNAHGNIKLALWELNYRKFNYSTHTEYDKSISNIIQLFLTGNFARLMEIRNAIFNLMITNFPSLKILRDLINCIVDNVAVSDEVKRQIIAHGSEIEYRMMKGRRDIIHFDYFTIFILNVIATGKLAITGRK